MSNNTKNICTAIDQQTVSLTKVDSVLLGKSAAACSAGSILAAVAQSGVTLAALQTMT